jgi:hypothetical protein
VKTVGLIYRVSRFGRHVLNETLRDEKTRRVAGKAPSTANHAAGRFDGRSSNLQQGRRDPGWNRNNLANEAMEAVHSGKRRDRFV